MTACRQLVWDDLLSAIVDQGEVVAGTEVSDFCSLLMLADHVFVAGDAEHPGPARLLALCLADLGFAARFADRANLANVRPDDVLVVIDVDESDALARQLEPALKRRPILLVITAGAFLSPLAAQADAAVLLPISRSPREPEPSQHRTGLQVMCFLAVDAIRSHLFQRIADQRLIRR